MLPSTGYFKGINCPFYDSGLCERAYCHFRHVKREPISGDGIESGNALLKLVSAAVQKVLQQTDTGAVATLPTCTTETDSTTCLQVSSKVTYNPTPIAELNKINNSELELNEEVSEQKKRHIPVPYTPRKPASLSIKRPIDTNGSKLIYVAPVTYTPGSETASLDPYKPKGSTESTEKYLPGSEVTVQEYAPKETQNPNTKVNYIPSDKNGSKKKILEYKPTKVKSQTSSVSYQPTPRSLVPCFSSDEDEPETKKRKLSSDLNGLDDLGPEFDILDQILDEEKSEKHTNNTKKESSVECKENKKNLEINNRIKKKDSKNHCKKIDKDKMDQKSDKRDTTKKKDKQDRSEKSERSDRNDKDHDIRRSSTDKKNSHNNKDKIRHSSSDRSEKKTHSKSSSSSSKHSKSSSSRHSKHSSNDKRDSKKNENSHRKSHSHSKESKDKKDKHKKKHSSNVSDDDNHNHDYLIEDEINELSEPDEDTIALECKRIFEEYIPTEKPETKDEHPDNLDTENEEYVSSKKRVSRTVEKNIKVIPKPPIKPDFKVNAAQAMTERLARVREFHNAKSASETSNPATVLKPETKPSFIAPISSHSKIRIAHVPYASTMLTAKKTITPKTYSKTNNDPSTSFTATQTVKKGSQRVAHLPSEKFIDRPGVLEPLGSKIQANIRLTYLNMMMDHCLKIYLSPTDAYARAQNEELITSKKCSTVPIYKNSAVLAISRLKKEVLECNGVKKSSIDISGQKPVAQGTVTNPAAAGSWSIENKNKRNFEDSKQFIGPQLYKNIQKWILTDEQLKENGFPRPHSNCEKGRAIIYGQNKQKPPKGFIRTCCRCKKEYTVDKKGFPVVKQDCIYHPNNKYRVRGEVKYQCCSQEGSSDGCCVASSHVYEYVDFENLKGYVKTLPPDRVMDDYGVYSLDCEMCYTTQGLDLTRVTVINSSCKVVYETLIRPLHTIIDYNTRYSGITEEQMAQVKTTLLEVQATLLTMFNSKTILIGHSLESDFKALKLIHDTVIDTSVLFPHKMGPPYKRALRNLSSEHLKKIIQNSVDGHDSAEDATVCMELLMYKVREDLKTR